MNVAGLCSKNARSLISLLAVPDTITLSAAAVVDDAVNRSVSWRSFSALLTLGILWFILCRHLSNEWSANEQYAYGWFVPFFAAYLLWLRWEDRPPPRFAGGSSKLQGPSSKAFAFVCLIALFLLLPLLLFEVGNPDWRPLGWAHALIVVGLTLLLVWRSGGTAWLRHFAFPVAFILVAVPWVTPIEAPIVQGLMRVVAAIAAETLALFGIPAQLEGSVIRISSGVVGVNEACSGVRSLQTSLMIGLLFGELKRLSTRRRFLLLAGALAIAFVANCARAFFLVWIAAERGVAAVAQWHDLAGYAILGAVFLGTVAVAAQLAEKTDPTDAAPSSLPPFHFPLSTFTFAVALTWLLAVEAGVESWYRAHERSLVTTPTWDVRWPENAPGFHEVSMTEDVRATLRFDHGRQVSWTAATPGKDAQSMSVNWSMFFFRWEPGRSSILRARAHRPDVCLPNTGWRVTDDYGVRAFRAADGVEMPFRHFAFTRDHAGQRRAWAHAFFCQREDRVPLHGRFDLTTEAAGVTGPWSRSETMRVVAEGLRNQGQQVLELVMMTPNEISGDAAQAKFAELVPQIVQVGAR